MSRRAIYGVNDLFTLRPDLMEEWDWERNTEDPWTLMVGSNYRAFWKCKVCGNRWECRLDSRTKNEHGCPVCSHTGGSIADYLLYLIVKGYCGDENVYYRYKLLPRMEMDCFVENLKVAFEYNGSYYHSSKKAIEKWERKVETCKEKGICLITIQESNDLTKIKQPAKNDIYYIPVFRMDSFDALKGNLLSIVDDVIGVSEKVVNLIKDVSLQSVKLATSKPPYDRSLAYELENNPKGIVFDYDKNDFKPEDVFCSIKSIRVWFKCRKGHSFLATPRKIHEGYGCGVCSGQSLRGARACEYSYNLGLLIPELKTLTSSLSNLSGEHFNIICPFCGNVMNYGLNHISGSGYTVDYCPCTAGKTVGVYVFGRLNSEDALYCAGVDNKYFLAIGNSSDLILKELGISVQNLSEVNEAEFEKQGIILPRLNITFNGVSTLPFNKKRVRYRLVSNVNRESLLSRLGEQLNNGFNVKPRDCNWVLLSKELLVTYFKERFEAENNCVFAKNRTVDRIGGKINSSLYSSKMGVIVTFKLNMSRKTAIDKLYQDVCNGVYDGTVLFTSELKLVDGSAGRFYIKEYVEQKDLQNYLNILYEGFERFYLSLWGGPK